MNIAEILLIASLFVPPAAVVLGVAVVLWPRGHHPRRIVRIEQAVVQH